MNKGFSRSCINFLFETHAIVLATQFNNFVAIYFRGVARNFQRGVTEATHCFLPLVSAGSVVLSRHEGPY